MAKITLFLVVLVCYLSLHSGVTALQCYSCYDASACAKPDKDKLKVDIKQPQGNSVPACIKEVLNGGVVSRGLVYTLPTGKPCGDRPSCVSCTTDLCNSAHRNQYYLLMMVVPLLYFFIKL